jgi:NMD protein affecting ribosome stability and mRNA decay
MADQKCSFPKGVTIKPDGINQLDPCLYETTEIHRNVTVEVRRCVHCGHVDIAWHRQDDTESEMVVNDNG